jgi:hypothetical protein
MKLRTLAAAGAALVALSATTALAAESVTAKLQQPLAQPTKFIAGGAVFVCEADACVAAVPTSQTFATGTCKAVAAKVGAVVSFSGSKALDDARLAQCNAGLPATTTVAKK